MSNSIRYYLSWVASIVGMFGLANAVGVAGQFQRVGAAQLPPPLPPAVYYGALLPNSAFTPVAGMVLEAYIDSNLCGQTETTQEENAITFTILVVTDAIQPGCGVVGRLVQFRVADHDLLPIAEWDNRQPQELVLRFLSLVPTATVTATVSPTPLLTATPTATPTPLPTATSTATTVPVNEEWLYLSSSSGGKIGNIRFADEDILAYSITTNTWLFVLDGSDVGLKSFDIDAVDYQDDGSFLISLDKDGFVPNVGEVGDEDILRFTPTSLGIDTQGRFALYFDGSDVDMTTSGEDIDAFTRLPTGNLLLSTIGTAKVSGMRANDEDLLLFVPTTLGSDTKGNWSVALGGRDIGLSTAAEDIWGLASRTNGGLLLSTLGSFNVFGVNGSGADVFACNSPQFGAASDCTFTSHWSGASAGFGGEIIDALDIGYGKSEFGFSVSTTGDLDDEDISEVDDEKNADEDDESSDLEENLVPLQIFIPLVISE